MEQWKYWKNLPIVKISDKGKFMIVKEMFFVKQKRLAVMFTFGLMC